MKFQTRMSIFGIVLLVFCSCKNTPLDPDPEYPYYTISGRVFEGYGGEPLADAQIKLEYTDQGSNFLEGIDAGVLGTTKTDADGYFTLDYQGFTGSPPDRELDGLYLYAGGKLILEVFPWNKTFERDFAVKDHFRMVLNIVDERAQPNGDTLFFGGTLLGAADYVSGGAEIVQFVNSFGINNEVFAVYPVRDTLVPLKYRFSSNYDHAPANDQVIFTTQKEWFMDSEKIIIVDAAWRGFPYSDTVSVTLTD